MKKYYFINKFDINTINKQDKNTTIIYRNYNSNHNAGVIQEIKNFCKKKGLIFILANNVKLAIQLNLDGVYLPSFNREFRHLSYSLKPTFLIIGSAHNLKEIKIKEIQNVGEIFLSPLFKKKGNKQLNIYKYLNLRKTTKMKDISLGGINKKNISKLKLIKPFGFAGISFFE